MLADESIPTENKFGPVDFEGLYKKPAALAQPQINLSPLPTASIADPGMGVAFPQNPPPGDLVPGLTNFPEYLDDSLMYLPSFVGSGFDMLSSNPENLLTFLDEDMRWFGAPPSETISPFMLLPSYPEWPQSGLLE